MYIYGGLIVLLLLILHLYAATPQPTVSLVNSTLHSLSISWSVKAPQYVTSYSVFWWKEFADIGRSVALTHTKFVIEDLLSNSAYSVAVLANGPLGNVNSSSKVFYTTPNAVQGKYYPNVTNTISIFIDN